MNKDEFTIVLRGINEKLTTIVEGHKLLNEKMDRMYEENKFEHQRYLILRKMSRITEITPNSTSPGEKEGPEGPAPPAFVNS